MLLGKWHMLCVRVLFGGRCLQLISPKYLAKRLAFVFLIQRGVLCLSSLVFRVVSDVFEHTT